MLITFNQITVLQRPCANRCEEVSSSLNFPITSKRGVSLIQLTKPFNVAPEGILNNLKSSDIFLPVFAAIEKVGYHSFHKCLAC